MRAAVSPAGSASAALSSGDGLRLQKPRRQAVEAGEILLPPIALDAGFTFALRPAVQHVPLGAIIEEWNAEAAGGLHQLDLQGNDLPRAQWRHTAEMRAEQVGEGRRRPPVNSAAPVEPEDQGRAIESAEHDGDPPARPDMRGRLVAASCAIEIGDGLRSEDAERVRAARRQIDMATASSRGDEENMLLCNERGMSRF